MKGRFLCACFLVSALRAVCAEDFLDRVDQALTISLFHDEVRTRLSGTLDLEYYHFPQPPPGLIRASGHDLFTPRLSVFLDAQVGPKVYLFTQTRLDNGFDPSDIGTQLRLDEYALRFTPWRDGRFNLQIGKFSTIVGGRLCRNSRNTALVQPNPTTLMLYPAFTAVSEERVTASYFSRIVPSCRKFAAIMLKKL